MLTVVDVDKVMRRRKMRLLANVVWNIESSRRRRRRSVDQNEATTLTSQAGCALPVAAIW